MPDSFLDAGARARRDGRGGVRAGMRRGQVGFRHRAGHTRASAWPLPRSPRPPDSRPTQTLVEVPPPPFSEGIFPCSDCHAQPDLPPNRTRRVLVDAHDDIVLKHDEQHRWCLDCHDATDRDALHLASGDLVPFAQSYTPVRAMPRREGPRLAGRRARPPNRLLERAQGVPAVRALSRPARATIQAPRAPASSGPALAHGAGAVMSAQGRAMDVTTRTACHAGSSRPVPRRRLPGSC